MMTLKKIVTEILALLGMMLILLRVVETLTQTHSKPLCFAVFVVAVFTPLVKTMMRPMKVITMTTITMTLTILTETAMTHTITTTMTTIQLNSRYFIIILQTY
jgi:hypothetical protein